ncbi:MAG TPA: hypothetical protein DCL48_15600 [Alphaproteobacteria bacterium]|nr:hypothetical protein [Alphaproteobacteria bacterium]
MDTNHKTQTLASKAAPAVKLLPKSPPSPATAGKREPFWRMFWPKLAPSVAGSPDPGLLMMGAVDLIAADMRSLLPADLQLKRMFVRYGHLLSEGEGLLAADDLRSIDHYVAEQAFGYARLRRKELSQKRVKISKATAFCVVTFPERKVRAHINFSLTGRGHEARGAAIIEITT